MVLPSRNGAISVTANRKRGVAIIAVTPSRCHPFLLNQPSSAPPTVYARHADTRTAYRAVATAYGYAMTQYATTLYRTSQSAVSVDFAVSKHSIRITLCKRLRGVALRLTSNFYVLAGDSPDPFYPKPDTTPQAQRCAKLSKGA